MGLSPCVVPVEEPVPVTLRRVPRKEDGVLCASACLTLILTTEDQLNHHKASRLDRLPVFCSAAMVADGESFSPSGAKPAAAVESWQVLGVPLTFIEPAGPVP